MSYIQDSLSDGEEIVAIFRIHTIFWFRLIAFCVLITAVTIGILSPLAIYWILKYRGIERGVTNKRVVSKRGIISRMTDEMKLSSIETVEIEQGVWGRILNFGTINITGRGESSMILKQLDEPLAVKKAIESVRPENDNNDKGDK